MPDEVLTSLGVRLRDKNGANAAVDNGSGLILHPETELKYLVMTTSGGIVVDSGNNKLYLDASSAWNAGIGNIVSGSYCPLEKVVSGSTQYADMYVAGGSATITEIRESTGYGTLLNVLSTTTSIRGIDSASNDYIPTERAAAMALAQKQHVLSDGLCTTISHGLNYDTVDVSVQSNIPLPALNVATQLKLPTEYVVRHAVDVASAANSTYASGLVSGLDAAIKASGYATKAHVSANFVSKTDSATVDSLGIVKVPANKGLSLDGGILTASKAAVVGTYATAGTSVANGAVGGVVVMSTLESAANATQSGYPVVPTVDAVYQAVQGAGGGGKPITSEGGIIVSDYTDSYGLKLAPASAGALGGVMVPANSGIYLSNTGAIKLSAATVDSIGGVIIGSGLGVSNTGKVYLNPAGNTSIGGVAVPADSGLVLTNGSVTLATATTASLGGVTVPNTGGIDIAADGAITLTTASYVTTSDGDSSGTTYKPLGGVRVYKSGGIQISNGVLALKEAQITSGFGYYNISKIGGVMLGSCLSSGYQGQPASTAVIAPTLDLVTVAVQEREPCFFVSSGVLNSSTNNATVHVFSGVLLDSDGTLLASNNNATVNFTQGSSHTIYAKFSSNTTTNKWAISYQLTSAADSAQVFYRPIAMISAGTGAGKNPYSVKFNGNIKQYQWNAVRLGENSGGVGGGYEGPFKASINGSTITIASGYIIDSENTYAIASKQVTDYNASTQDIVYLEGSVDLVGKPYVKVTAAPTYQITVGGVIYTRNTPVDTAEVWKNGNNTKYTSRGILPRVTEETYSDAALTTTAGAVTAVTYSITTTRYATDGTAAATGETRTAYLPSILDTPVMSPVTAWVLANNADPIWSPTPWLSNGDYWVKESAELVGGYKAGASTNLPAKKCIPIAKLNATTATQQQYGNIILPYTSQIPKEHFQIIDLPVLEKSNNDWVERQYRVNGVNCRRLVLRTYRAYTAMASMVMEVAGLMYGVDCHPDLFTGKSDPTSDAQGRGMWVNRYAFEYPKTDNVTYVVGTQAAVSVPGDDALYIVPSDGITEIWFNAGWQVGPQYTNWAFQITTSCNENDPTTGTKWYSVLLARMVGTDAELTQIHKGPIQIRGRWG